MAVFLLDISAESLHNMSEPNIFLHLFYINVILNKVQENIFFAVIKVRYEALFENHYTDFYICTGL